jgi:hypothetical protein
MSSSNQQTSLSTSKTDTTALALLGAMLIALAIGGATSLNTGGTGALGDIIQAVGIGRTATIEAEQRRQLAAITELERRVQALTSELTGKTARLDLSDLQETAVKERFALVEADIGAIAIELRSLRMSRDATPQAVPASMPGWVADHLNSAVTAAHNDIAALRSSLDEHGKTIRQDIDTIAHRLDRLEQMMTHDLTASVAPAPRKKSVRRRARGVGSARVGVTRRASAARTRFGAPSNVWMAYPGIPMPRR